MKQNKLRKDSSIGWTWKELFEEMKTKSMKHNPLGFLISEHPTIKDDIKVRITIEEIK